MKNSKFNTYQENVKFNHVSTEEQEDARRYKLSLAIAEGRDLFECVELLPKYAQSVLNQIKDVTFEEYNKANTKLAYAGYGFEYDMDGSAFGLKRLQFFDLKFDDGDGFVLEPTARGENLVSILADLKKLGWETEHVTGARKLTEDQILNKIEKNYK